MAKKKLNLPNKLTLFRFFMVPVFILAMYFIPDSHWVVRNCVGAGIFLICSLTDLFDGKIARKYNLITDFGKFLDPLADKFIVISAMTMIFYLDFYSHLRSYFVFVFIVVMLREFAVTGLRLVIANKGVVLPAKPLGKIKTSLQMTFIMTALLEPVIYRIFGILPYIEGNTEFLAMFPPLTLLTMAGAFVFTLWSGIDYFVSCGSYIDPEK